MPLLQAQTDSISNPAIDKVISVVNSVEQASNYIDELSPDSIASLPIGMIKKIGEARYVIAIDSVNFKPTGAYFNAYAAIDFPGSDKKLAFEAVNIKFNPKGVVGGNQARLMLVSQHLIRINNIVSLRVLPDGKNFVEWDCNGFKAISLKGEFIFNKGKLKADKSQTGSDSLVRATFEIYTSDIHDFIAQVNITPFTIDGLEDWSFNVKNATVDMSELHNAQNMIFPAGYNNPNMVTPQMWTGFYLKDLKVKLPTQISKAGKRTEIEVHNLLIDNMGVTGLFQINNLMTMNEGSMSGWGFSVEELGVGFVCNQLNSGHLKGKVHIPVFDSAQALVYNANIYYNPQNKNTDYNFIINTANNLEFKVASAKIDLYNTSVLSISQQNGLFKPKAVLNGKISFTNSKFDSKGGYLTFQSLTVETQSPYITNGIFTLHTSVNQTRAANYPISIADITFGIDMGAPILGFSVTLNVADNPQTGFSMGTKIRLKGKVETSIQTFTGDNPITVTKTNYKFDKVVVDGISLKIKTSVLDLEGLIVFRDNDPVYGDGFYGQVLFSIENVIPEKAALYACYGAKENYRYYYYGASIPCNLPLGSIPIAITKLVGGVYNHMRPQYTSQQHYVAAAAGVSSTTNTPMTYVPDQAYGFGFKAGVGFIYYPSEKTANGDVMLEVSFTSSGGLNTVNLSGDVFIMAERSERAKAPIKGNIVIQYDALNKVFDANASITVNAYNAVTGTGTTKIHIEPAYWYVAVGKPSTPVTVNILNLVNATSYFMVGSLIEPAQAPPPEVNSILGQSGITSVRNQSQLQSGAGFCTGAKIYSNINKQFDLDFFKVYGGFNFGVGFDMMMMNYGKDAYCSGSGSKVGMNGWLASGSMYLYMQGSVGVSGNIKFLPDCNCESNWCYCSDFNIKIFDGGVAAIVSGKMPKPLFLSGQFGCYYNILGKISGNFNYDYSYGEDCNIVN